MTSKFKQKVAAIAVATGIAFGASACGQFAPSNDVTSIVAAVKQAIIEQNNGNVKLDCRFDPAHRIAGVSAEWSSTSGDHGYVCVGGLSTSSNLYNDLGGSTDDSNSVPPFYPIAYSNFTNNGPTNTVYGAAVIATGNTVYVQINHPEGWEDTQTIATANVPGLNKNPFAIVQRK